LSRKKAGAQWDVNEIHEVALQYTTRNEFNIGNSIMYRRAKEIGIFDEVCSHMVSGRKMWTRERLIMEAAEYTSRNEFRKQAPGAYSAALKMKLIDDVCKHMTPLNEKWTAPRIKEEVAKYTTMAEFRQGALTCYMKLKTEGTLDQYCNHYPKKFRYTYENVMGIASEYKTRTEFIRNASGAYKYAKVNGFREEACAHMLQGNIKYTDEDLHDIALKYTTRTNFQQNEPSPYAIACQRGILDKICTHMLSNYMDYTEENVLEVLSKYGTFSSFREDAPHKVQKFRDRGFQYLMEDYFEEYTPPIQWTEDMVYAEARRYHSRKKFIDGSPSAASAAFKRGIYEEVTAHMPMLGNRSDNNAIYIWKVTDNLYPDTYKIGYTSLRSGTYRIFKIASELGVNYEIIALTETEGKATVLEGILHSIGDPIEMPEGLDGRTEFRKMDYSQLEECMFEIFCNKNNIKSI
jgi:hypothetical protein